MQDTLDRLMAQVRHRVAEMPSGSYTTQLISGGAERMGAKIAEEAREVVEAAQDLEAARATAQPPEAVTKAKDHLTYEACDLIYHLWVLLGSKGISVDDLRGELARREGTSGLEEKRQRPS